MNIPDHPLIARTLETGYPYPEPEERMCDCGRALYGTIYIVDGTAMCEKCCKTVINANYNTAELAEALGISVVDADEYDWED